MRVYVYVASVSLDRPLGPARRDECSCGCVDMEFSFVDFRDLDAIKAAIKSSSHTESVHTTARCYDTKEVEVVTREIVFLGSENTP